MIRLFGADLFGKFLFVQSVVMTLTVFIEFGFNLYGTKIVAQNQDSKILLSRYVSSIFLIKLVLLIITLIAYTFSVYILADINEIKLYLSMVPLLFGEFGYAMWYFQGREQVYKLAVINLISKTVLIFMIFNFVSEKNDLILFSVIFACSSLLNGIASIYYIYRKDKISLVFFEKGKIKSIFIESSSLFLSRLSTLLLLRGNSLIVGLLLGPVSLSIYDLAMKLLNLGLLPLQMLNQALYPAIAKSGDIKKALKIIVYIFPMTLIATLFSWVVIEPIIILFAGEGMTAAANIWVIVSLIIPTSAISYFLGNTIILVKGYSKEFNNSIYFGLSVYFLCVTFASIFECASLESLSIAFLLNSIFICVYRIKTCIKNIKISS